MTSGGRIELSGVSKAYGAQQVLNGIDLTVESGEFFSLLGPSGCGKTTTLRLIGGFEPIESGTITIDGVDLRDLPPERRPVNTVFQNYALFPHKTVADNVGFGLRFVNCTRAEARQRVGEALELVQMAEYAGRRPHQLSGGQQQRVALARALVLRPKVLLLDEPLGALDAKLRRTLQAELRALHRDVGITFVYVTHDQEEALTMSDRLAVMRSGDVVQVGTPREVYDNPANAYVADFLGLANLLPAIVQSGLAQIDGWAQPIPTNRPDGEVTVLVRPERIAVAEQNAPPGGTVTIAAIVETTTFAGPAVHTTVRAGGHRLLVVTPRATRDDDLIEGAAVTLAIAPDAVVVLAVA